MTAPDILPAPETEARRKAREIVASLGPTSLEDAVAIAWLEGKLDGMRELRAAQAEALAKINTPVAKEYDAFCCRCGARAGTRMAAVPPEQGFFEVVCFHCSAGDEPGRAA